jgi:hypothetical protein
MAIDATARVADGARIGDGVDIGPYCVVGPHVELKDGVRLIGQEAAGVTDHNVEGSFTSRIAEAHLGRAAENIAAGSKTWAETFRLWQNSPRHNANLLQSPADSVGVAMARNDQTRYKTFWAMVIAEKSPASRHRKGDG